MLKWVTLMACHRGGEGTIIRYAPELFGSLECQIIMIEYLPYSVMDDTGHPYMPILARMEWGDLSKNFTFWSFYVFQFLFLFLIKN